MNSVLLSKPVLSCLATLMLAFACASVQAADVAAGKAKSTACAACHGTDGNSATPLFPKIAGQHEDYLLHSLMAYKKGDRSNEIMKGQVAALSDTDMKDLAAYFSAQKSDLHAFH